MSVWKVYRSDGTVDETSEPERYRFEVTYTDGSIFKQYGDDGIKYNFYDIDQSRLYAFTVVSDVAQPITIFWRPGMKLIWFWRTLMAKTQGAGAVIARRVCVFGYQEGHSKVLFVVDENDCVYVVDDLDKMEW